MKSVYNKVIINICLFSLFLAFGSPLFSYMEYAEVGPELREQITKAECALKQRMQNQSPMCVPEIEKGFNRLFIQREEGSVFSEIKGECRGADSLKAYFKACTIYLKAKTDEMTGNHEQAFEKYVMCSEILKDSKFSKWTVFPCYLANKNAGEHLIALEKWAEASKYFQNCLDARVRPGGTRMRALLIRCFLKTDEIKKAYENLRYIEQKNPDFYSIEKCPDYEIFNYERALCCYKNADYEGSLETFRTLAKSSAVSEKTKCASVFYCARSHEELGNISEARLNYQWMISYYNSPENEYFCSMARKRLKYLEKRYMGEEILNFAVNG